MAQGGVPVEDWHIGRVDALGEVPVALSPLATRYRDLPAQGEHLQCERQDRQQDCQSRGGGQDCESDMACSLRYTNDSCRSGGDGHGQ